MDGILCFLDPIIGILSLEMTLVCSQKQPIHWFSLPDYTGNALCEALPRGRGGRASTLAFPGRTWEQELFKLFLREYYGLHAVDDSSLFTPELFTADLMLIRNAQILSTCKFFVDKSGKGAKALIG
jgi:hypothetical protein